MVLDESVTTKMTLNEDVSGCSWRHAGNDQRDGDNIRHQFHTGGLREPHPTVPTAPPMSLPNPNSNLNPNPKTKINLTLTLF